MRLKTTDCELADIRGMPQILYQPMMEKCFPPLTGIMIRRRIAARVQIPSKVDGGITSKDVVKPLVPSVVSNGPLFLSKVL